MRLVHGGGWGVDRAWGTGSHEQGLRRTGTARRQPHRVWTCGSRCLKRLCPSPAELPVILGGSFGVYPLGHVRPEDSPRGAPTPAARTRPTPAWPPGREDQDGRGASRTLPSPEASALSHQLRMYTYSLVRPWSPPRARDRPALRVALPAALRSRCLPPAEESQGRLSSHSSGTL